MPQKKPGGTQRKAGRTRDSKNRSHARNVYQFEITLIGIEPPIWRRIQVEDCTLSMLHDHIQDAMGWSDSHLHQFTIRGQLYGDPMLFEESFAQPEFQDSTTTMLSELFPSNRRCRILYEYDFGDSWEHEIQFEGRSPANPKVRYPVCLDGERACPPEDVGGVWAYADLLDAIADNTHEQHEASLDWIGEQFDPEKFDPAKATRAMRMERSNWR